MLARAYLYLMSLGYPPSVEVLDVNDGLIEFMNPDVTGDVLQAVEWRQQQPTSDWF